MKDSHLNKAGNVRSKGWMLFLMLAAALQFAVPAAYGNKMMTTVTGQIQPGTAPDTLVFYYYRNYLFNMVGVEETLVLCDAKGRFRFSVADAVPVGRLDIVVKGRTPSYSLQHYLQRGDSIYLELHRRAKGMEFRFSGIGSSKFSAKQQLDSLSDVAVANMRSIPELTLHPGAQQAARLSVIFNRLAYTEKLQLEVLKGLEPKLSREIHELMRVDVISYARERKYFNYWFTAQRNKVKPVEDPLVKMFYELESSAGAVANQPLLRISRNYMEMLVRMAMVRDFVHGAQGLIQTYRLVKYGSPFELRDRAVTSYLLSNPKSAKAGAYEQCIRDARKSATDTVDRQVLDGLLAAYRTGSQLFDFELTKTDGSTFPSSSVRGRVLLVDFWFMGCTACIKQTREFNLHVVPKIKMDNKPVTILSVNLDKKLEDWKASLASGKYSIEGSVDLHTGGLAFNHPLAKFYQIQACPRLLVFDQSGNLVASDPDLKSLLSLIDDLVKP